MCSLFTFQMLPFLVPPPENPLTPPPPPYTNIFMWNTEKNISSRYVTWGYYQRTLTKTFIMLFFVDVSGGQRTAFRIWFLLSFRAWRWNLGYWAWWLVPSYQPWELFLICWKYGNSLCKCQEPQNCDCPMCLNWLTLSKPCSLCRFFCGTGGFLSSLAFWLHPLATTC